jgi:hypothetical protein
MPVDRCAIGDCAGAGDPDHRIIATGASADIVKYADAQIRVIDLEGRTLIAGLIDSVTSIAEPRRNGRFRRNGPGTDVDPDKVEFVCGKSRYRTNGVMRCKMSTANFLPLKSTNWSRRIRREIGTLRLRRVPNWA